jgi:CRP-like cAMP-binding protein
MAKKPSKAPKQRVSELLLRKAMQHGTLLEADKAAILSLRPGTRLVSAGEDLVRQGDRPDVAVMVLSGMLARYHTLPSGDRQYVALHISGDLPDVQSLFLSVMDHSLCALDRSEVGVIPHDQLRDLFLKRPGVGFAFWRLTLVDAAIFREAVTNIGARNHVARLAHLFCEQYVRSREARLVDGWSCRLPLTQGQIGQMLGMSHISVHRALQRLRKERLAEFRSGELEVTDWRGLRHAAGFDPTYLHLQKKSEISQTAFRRPAAD